MAVSPLSIFLSHLDLVLAYLDLVLSHYDVVDVGQVLLAVGQTTVDLLDVGRGDKTLGVTIARLCLEITHQ